jgi:hypothetical protein
VITSQQNHFVSVTIIRRRWLFMEVTYVYSKDYLKIGIIGITLIVNFKCGTMSDCDFFANSLQITYTSKAKIFVLKK